MYCKHSNNEAAPQKHKNSQPSYTSRTISKLPTLSILSFLRTFTSNATFPIFAAIRTTLNHTRRKASIYQRGVVLVRKLKISDFVIARGAAAGLFRSVQIVTLILDSEGCFIIQNRDSVITAIFIFWLGSPSLASYLSLGEHLYCVIRRLKGCFNEAVNVEFATIEGVFGGWAIISGAWW